LGKKLTLNEWLGELRGQFDEEDFCKIVDKATVKVQLNYAHGKSINDLFFTYERKDAPDVTGLKIKDISV